jgi:hypothetical protein
MRLRILHENSHLTWHVSKGVTLHVMHLGKTENPPKQISEWLQNHHGRKSIFMHSKLRFRSWTATKIDVQISCLTYLLDVTLILGKRKHVYAANFDEKWRRDSSLFFFIYEVNVSAVPKITTGRVKNKYDM